MIDFTDETETNPGTLLNRYAMMGIQGFISCSTVFNDDGSITETNEQGHTLTTTFNDDGSITETFVGEKTISKKTTFGGNSISEVIL